MYLDELDVGAFLHHNFLCGHLEISLLVPARAWVEVGAGGTRVRLLGTIAYRRELVCSCKRKDDEYGRSILKILVKS